MEWSASHLRVVEAGPRLRMAVLGLPAYPAVRSGQRLDLQRGGRTSQDGNVGHPHALGSVAGPAGVSDLGVALPAGNGDPVSDRVPLVRHSGTRFGRVAGNSAGDLLSGCGAERNRIVMASERSDHLLVVARRRTLAVGLLDRRSALRRLRPGISAAYNLCGTLRPVPPRWLPPGRSSWAISGTSCCWSADSWPSL